MKIIDYSTPDLSPKYQIFWRSQISLRETKFMIVEVLAASLIFIIPVLALFILSK